MPEVDNLKSTGMYSKEVIRIGTKQMPRVHMPTTEEDTPAEMKNEKLDEEDDRH